MEIQLNNILASQAATGLQQGVFCGISAGVSFGAGDQRIRAFYSGGVTRNDALGVDITKSTLFDLASLTKPLCSVLCALHLIDKGKLHWQSTLGPWFPLDKQHITLQHLLQHTSGFPAYHPYFKLFPAQQHDKHKERLLESVSRESLVYATGSTSVYSDLGFMVLGKILEERSGSPLHHLFSSRIATPLGIEDQLRFMPLDFSPHPNMSRIAATEVCPWRKKTLQGEVHDEHCWLLGGVAGHAGLFGTVEAVVRLCECLLDIWKGRASHPGFTAPLLIHALSSKHPHSSWCLGFDTPSVGVSSSGKYFSPQSVGHLGFSGTSFWIDPEREVIVVLLTNRIHPSRENAKIRQFRPTFHDRIMEQILEG